MTEVIGVRFKDTGKIYFFAPNGFKINAGDHVIVETSRGVECGLACESNKMVDDEEVVSPLKPVIRLATKDDLKTLENNKIKESSAYDICVKKIKKHNLDMNLTDVEYAFDGSKIIFFFTADGRVDFRELVKDLAGTFHSRIELRQIGVRDESKMIGGLGICGRPFCCSTFLNDFHSVSIKMAKEQGLSLSPSKISGTCGRLMCCLKYEQNSYDYLQKITPRKGAIVDCREGRGVVVDVSLLTGMLKVKLDHMPDGAPIMVNREEIYVVKDGKHQNVSKKEAEALKHLEKN